MNLKNYLLALPLVAASLTGCVSSDSPILVLNAAALPSGVGADCSSPSEELVVSQGSLDLSGGVGFIATFFIESNLQATETNVDGEVVAGPEQNDFITDRIDITYTNQVGGPVPGALSEPKYFVLARGRQGSFISVNLLPEAARAALAGVGPVGTEMTRQIPLTSRASARDGTTPSNEVKSDRPRQPVVSGAAAGTQPVFNGVCGGFGGQDGTAPTCSRARRPLIPPPPGARVTHVLPSASRGRRRAGRRRVGLQHHGLRRHLGGDAPAQGRRRPRAPGGLDRVRQRGGGSCGARQRPSRRARSRRSPSTPSACSPSCAC